MCVEVGNERQWLPPTPYPSLARMILVSNKLGGGGAERCDGKIGTHLSLTVLTALSVSEIR